MRERIIDAAASLFARRGFRATAMEEIAETASVAKGSIYYHFKGKDELLGAVIEEGFALIRRAVHRSVTAYHSPTFQLETLIRKHLALHIEYDDLARVIFHDKREGLAPAVAERIGQVQREYTRFVADLIGRAVAAGHLRVLDPEVAATSLLGSLGAVARNCTIPHADETVAYNKKIDALADQMVQMWFEGVAAR